jgi:hypothetical protein
MLLPPEFLLEGSGESLGIYREEWTGNLSSGERSTGPVPGALKQYRDLPMDLADASLVALAEKYGVSKVFTLDHKDFSIYRFKGKTRFKLMPAKV